MQVSNAIAWGHMQLKGGWKNILLTSGGYLLLIGGLIAVTLRLDPAASRQLLGGWVMALMSLQIGTMVLFACYAISAAVRKDVTTKVIESHRLMPVSGIDAVVGYMIGPACQAIALSLVNLLLGMIISPWAGVDVVAWLKANFVLGVFAACAWVGVVFLPLVMPVGSRILMGLIWVVVIGYQVIPGTAPGLSMLVGPALNDTVFGIIASGQVTDGQKISMVAQVLLAVLCYVGAARKYRRDDVLAWGPIMGLIVLASYAAISVTGLTLWEAICPRMLRLERTPFEIQFFVAAFSALLAGILPVSAAAWLRTVYERRRQLHDPAPNRRPVPLVLVAIVAAVIVAALLPLAVEARWHVYSHFGDQIQIRRPPVGPLISKDMIVRTFLIAMAFLLSVGCLLGVMYRRLPRSTRVIVSLFVGLMWVGPIILDIFVTRAMNGFDSDMELTRISAISPPVALVCIWWQEAHINTTAGIAVQVLLAISLAIAYYTTKRAVPVKTPVAVSQDAALCDQTTAIRRRAGSDG